MRRDSGPLLPTVQGRKPCLRSCQPPHVATSQFCTRSQNGLARVDGKAVGVTDCFRNRIYRTPFPREVSGVAKLSSNRQGSGLGGSELEPLKPGRLAGPGTGACVTGDEGQVRLARPSGWHRRTTKEAGPSATSRRNGS